MTASKRNNLVSTIIPVYNGERYLAEAVESVLTQTYQPIEVIVVDDGSVDGTARIAKSYEGIRYIYQTNQGQAAAMNAGIGAAQGAFIAFLDCDDLWPPHKLAMQVEYLLEHPRVGYVIGRIQNFLEPGARLPSRRTKDLSLTEYAALSVGTLVARKKVFDLVGNFDSSYAHAKDVDWFVRAREAHVHAVILPEVLLHRRLHDSNRVYRVEAKTSEFLRAVKASIARKRSRHSGGEV